VETAREYDVIVAGGGPSGIAAALAAAACGARVLVIEREAVLGGNVARALVHTICGLFLPSPERQAVHAHAGLPRALATRLQKDGSAGGVEWAGGAGFVAIDPFAFASLAECLLAENSRIDVERGASVTVVALADSGPSEVCFLGENGRAGRAAAWNVIDTSGDAVAATLAGAATEQAAAADLQHASYIFRIDGADADALDNMERARTSTAVARAARSGELPASACSIVVRAGLPAGSFYVTLNLPKPVSAGFDPLDAACFRSVEELAGRDADAVFAFLVATRPPLRHATIGAKAARFGIRETRRVRGLVRLEQADVLAGTRRDDEACMSTWPVELWHSHERMTFRHVAAASSIPLGCLVADHPSGRLAMAGRCASASHEALGAIRVIGTSMATGEAAGVLAALAAARRSSLAAIDAAEVRALVASGATAERV
jgi:hypothetical protein